MSDINLPKEAQDEYQRWEMSILSAEGKTHSRKVERAKPKVPDELAQILENARIEGFKKGYTKGMKEGYEAGMQKAAEHEQAIVELARTFTSSLKEADEKIAGELLTLALDIAKAMLKTNLDINHNRVLAVVKESIRYLPIVNQPARILLNPVDVEAVKLNLAEELAEGGWLIIEDQAIERGGCMVETPSNQIDATNSTRWKRISNALGQPSEWLDESNA
ncbi:MAG: flagellar assembly protein FliH [Betaproteobacteria bacterium HGW-Betaproteobacteria-8]|nr:MAG: flagellar assembly protein FliH [Betaproteobacteria bacterium HGW-Betaproteobacteria-8]